MRTRQRTHVAALLLAAACSGEPLQVRVLEDGDPLPREQWPAEVDEACEILGVECTADTGKRSRHAVQLELVDEGTHGQCFDRGASLCRRDCESPRIPKVIAHELAHANGLEHVDDPDDLFDTTAPLMCPHCMGETLTDDESAALQDAIDLYTGACP